MFISHFSAVHGNVCALVFKESLGLNVFLNAAEGSGGDQVLSEKESTHGSAKEGRKEDVITAKPGRDVAPCADVCCAPSEQDRTVEVAQAGFPVGLGPAQREKEGSLEMSLPLGGSQSRWQVAPSM